MSVGIANGVAQSKTTASRGQSQWDLVFRQFCKRRLALAAALMLLLLVTVSIFAPFLANDRPIYFTGVNRFEYQEAARTLRGTLGPFSQAKPDASYDAGKIEEVRTTVRLQVRLMSQSLAAEQSAKLREWGTRVDSVLATPEIANAAGEFKTLQNELRSQFDAKKVTLRTRTFWPVIASLTGKDIAFVVGIVLLLTTPIWGRLLARIIGASRDVDAFWCWLIFLGLPLASGITWWSLVPHRIDRTNYKEAVLVVDDSEMKAPVVFESVVWPPISYGIDENDLAGKSQPPAWYRKKTVVTGARNDSPAKIASRWSGSHWLGTDELGRDVLCRMVWGGRVSLSVGIVAVAIYVTIGIIIGAIAGYFRGTSDLIISRIIEVVICFPAFFLILTIVAMVGPGLFNIMIVIGLTGWTGIARLVRGEFLRLVDQEFVLAGKALGFSPARIIFRHVLPNALAPVLVSATFGVAGAILTESALSFLGLGITVPTPSWGGILADGRQALERAPWLIHFPGLAIFITITSYNLVGEALRDAADPRLHGSR